MTDRARVIVGIAKARPGGGDELKELLLSFVPLARAEPGCLEFHVHQGQGDPDTVAFYEAWRTQEDLDRHQAQPYLRSFMDNRTRYLDGDVTVHLLSMESPHPRLGN